MLKVAKFGGSSMADAKQFEKVRDIVRADPARKVIVVSAAGKRSADDHKLTDLLYLCYAHLQYGVNCDAVFQMICDRYIAIRDACGLSVDIEAELDVLRQQLRSGISEEELVSRGEYFSALLMADYLGYSFLDAELWVRFQFDGSIDKEASYAALRRLADGRSVVIPGFYGVTPDGKIRTFLFPRRHRHHRRARGRGARCRRVRKLDGRVRHPYGRPPHRARPAAHRAHHL